MLEAFYWLFKTWKITVRAPGVSSPVWSCQDIAIRQMYSYRAEVLNRLKRIYLFFCQQKLINFCDKPFAGSTTDHMLSYQEIKVLTDQNMQLCKIQGCCQLSTFLTEAVRAVVRKTQCPAVQSSCFHFPFVWFHITCFFSVSSHSDLSWLSANQCLHTEKGLFFLLRKKKNSVSVFKSNCTGWP